ncbi:cystatin-like fold lipoprotein [Staphylococcus aureus]|uniref:cystatin-like fold lipoprotein n=1 Tax=Staphylococcus aureus TaxID=1280 RepID=UPI0012477436|nr:cystatin-like fold lipoprotein [Staphylococcus aureus]
MRKLFLLFISSIFVLSACGNKYDKEIEEVTKLEQESVKKSKLDDRKSVNRDSSDFKVYDDGNVITISLVAFKNSDTVVTSLYKLNQTTGKYEEDLNENVTKYQKNNKPDFEENNMKK